MNGHIISDPRASRIDVGTVSLHPTLLRRLERIGKAFAQLPNDGQGDVIAFIDYQLQQQERTVPNA